MTEQIKILWPLLGNDISSVAIAIGCSFLRSSHDAGVWFFFAKRRLSLITLMLDHQIMKNKQPQ